MSVPTHVFHHGAKPISLTEFRHALDAVCSPRFPAARHARPRRVALAISGGVDSMAMAFLFSNLIRTHRDIKIADNPTDGVFGIIIDHQLRPDSTLEAAAVAQELKKLGLKAVTKSLSWKNPSSLTNIESVARTKRYRMLGSTCRYLNATSLFFAHHRDDQYETVLMRYMSGHRYRGYQGIRDANAIPECYDLHGVYKSGLLDDQSAQYPYLSFKPPNKEMRRLRWMLKDNSECEPLNHLKYRLGVHDLSARFPGHIIREVDPRVPYLTPLNCEDGGVMVYRPLLEFDKDRLVATCEANKIKWFEDPTNADPTLTPRNAIRHMDRSLLRPELRKEAILDMSREAKRRARLEDAEARRWLMREAVIQDFDPNAGTLLVELACFKSNTAHWRRLSAKPRAGARKPHQRLIAAIAVRKLVEFVTPDINVPPLANLDNVVDRLFPELASQPDPSPPRAFTIAGVVFDPIVGPSPTKWFLSRAPFSSMKPLPEQKLPGHLNYHISPLVGQPGDPNSRHRHWRTWKAAKLWDGRYWIRVSACVPARFHILPLLPHHAKPFRKALPPKQLARLEQILKYYAPGKIRYSLPALYIWESIYLA
ncbi:PP-loop family protein [Metarhizium album ARSEF 1941]|uniref:tRNA(Ile)-lysidine synthetase n=1 Tax=Metarhizium album (strain ARSEF 1941) TaxID=1081103 RepID=A0A0B2WP24_METAS|nr:PP-loop family protein [Metarhizium album ARSEF 1941]KHN97781.1 PP-loop family protein [Metarhizium album ARSEF 1941]